MFYVVNVIFEVKGTCTLAVNMTRYNQIISTWSNCKTCKTNEWKIWINADPTSSNIELMS